MGFLVLEWSMANGLPDYSTSDVSSTSSPSVSHPGRGSVDGTLVHSTDGRDSLPWLTGGSALAGSPASSDFLIRRTGERIKLCADSRFPYHAGTSRANIAGRWFYGDEVSSRLLGVELECLWADLPTYSQLDSLAELIVSEGQRRGWRWPYVILAHSGVATPAGRRSDPWLLDWGSLAGRLFVRAQAASIPGLIVP